MLAQGNNVLSVQNPERLVIKRGTSGEVKLKAELRAGFHVNSNTPSDPFLVPLKLTWANQPLQTEQVTFPKPQLEKYEFSPAPLSVFSGAFDIVTRFRAPANAASGMNILVGKLRYQACNDRECLAPRTLDVHLTVEIQ